MDKEFIQRLEKVERSLNKAVNMNFDNKWQQASFGNLSAAVTPGFIQNLIEPNKTLIDLGGKRWRPLLMLLCYEMFKERNAENTAAGVKILSEQQVYDLTPLVEFVHTASLIHDDIEDSADLRRGKPAAHITYGLDTALNAASWFYFEAPVCINNVVEDRDMQLCLYEVYTQELRRLHLGQAMDIFWHRNPSVFPEQEEYFSMVKCKTGTLSCLAAKVGALCGGASLEEAEKIGEIAANIGIGFQIIDDVQNLTKGNPGKKRGDDIVEGKKSLPVLIHVQKNPDDKTVLADFMTKAAKEGIDSPAVEDCIKVLESSKCINSAAEIGVKFIQENCEKLQSPLIQKLFTSMIPEDFR